MLKSLLTPLVYLKDTAASGLHMLIPAMGSGGSPPSSPSNTPVNRRRSLSRNKRPKPRARKSAKQPKPASADISTQETTTPGPNSSDTTDETSSHDESHLNPGAGEDCDHNGITEEPCSHSGTPNPLSASSESSSRLGSGSEPGGGLGYSSPVDDPIEPDIVRKATSISSNSISLSSSLMDGRVLPNDVGSCKSNSEENLHRDSCETSDTDLTSLSAHPPSHSAQRKPRVAQRNMRRLDSDFSTAPLSSETSDMDTSGNEKATDGGSTSDLTSLSRDSRSEASEVFTTPPKPRPPAGGGSAKGSSGGSDLKRRDGKSVPAVSKKPAARSPAVTASKRPVQKSISTPISEESRMAHPADVKSKVHASLKVPPARPKPPLAAKPSKPEVRPKPSITAATTASCSGQQQSPKLHLRSQPSSELSANDSDSVDFASQRSKSTVEAFSKKPAVVSSSSIAKPVMRKAWSEGDFIPPERKGAQSPTFFIGKLSKVCEESEEKDSDAEKVTKSVPTKFSLSPKPLLPNKPKPPPAAAKRVSPTPYQQPGGAVSKPKSSLRTSNEDVSSASDTTSSQSSSSPAVRRKPALPLKPTVPPKKPSLTQQGGSPKPSPVVQRSNSALRSPIPEQRAATREEKGPSPPRKPPTKRRASREASLHGSGNSASVSPPPVQRPTEQSEDTRLGKEQLGSVESLTRRAQPPSPTSSQEDAPPVPPRMGNRRSVLSEVSIPVAGSTPSAQDGERTPPPPGGKQTPPIYKKPKSPPRRPPPSPPPVPKHAETAASNSSVGAVTSDPETHNRHSLFSSDLTEKQVSSIAQVYEVSIPRGSQQAVQNRPPERLFKIASMHKRSDSDQGVSRKHPTHYELTFLETDVTSPPPMLYKRTSDSSGVVSPLSSDDVPPPLPTQPIPKKKDRQALLKRGPIQSQMKHANSSPTLAKNGESGKTDTQSLSSEGSAGSVTPPKNPVYDVISDRVSSKVHKGPSPRLLQKLTSRKCITPTEDAPFRRETKSFSSFMFRRSNSDRFKKNKVASMDPGMSTTLTKQALHRTPSLDKLDDRMERSVRLSGPADEDDSSSDEEETVLSPTQQALPQPPIPRYTASPKPQKRKLGRTVSAYVVPADEEPLYQYINTAEFLRTPQENVKCSGPTKNQLEIARQLSNKRLWCEQPEIIKSGVLQSLSEDEKKLQEAIFEVVTTEATYLRSLDVLIDHFMEDPGMNPNLPEGRRVLDKRQHHVIFSNVKEVREISAKFLEELQARQKETTVIKSIADIILDYAESKFDCYIHYCTNQVYQTRELQECLEKSTMFREYLKRLESHRKCQNLSMQSFLLLPMQRITRLPLLILAILNKTPLDHPDHGTVERSLRRVQKLVTECNDGARKMERTEQLHNIHQQLDFGKLKPFPLVSVSRQLERRGTLIRLRVEQKLFGRHQIKRKQLYVFVFTDLVIVTKRKKDPKGEYVYKVVDYSSRALVEMEDIEAHPGVSFPKHTFGEQDTVANATWAVSTAGEKHAFLLILLDNVHHHSEKYIFVAQNDTDKTRWMESLATPESQREDEKIYQHWDCPQVQAIYDYKAVQPDELSLERGDVVKVFRKMADGWYEGERLRDLQWGWFPSNFTTEVENEHTRARNLKETHRLLSLPYSPEEYVARITTIR